MKAPACSAESLAAVLDALDVLVYVSDLDTHELLFLNAYGRKLWGEPAGRKCWQVLQADQCGPCDFCTNSRLVDEQGQPNPVTVWEFCNTHTDRWYQCRDQAIPWTDGRLVRLEVAVDITEQKQLQAELVTAHARARSQAYTDVLTGLANRRAYFEYSPEALQRARELERSVAVVMFDLDNFKTINDRYGHAAGDAVLVEVGSLLQLSTRDKDIACRLGGEEFSVTLIGVDGDQASAMAERLRRALETTPVRIDSDAGELVIPVTASFGVAADTTGTLSLEELLAKADAALYRAKSLGRNRVETCE